ncbi:hypothetical protein [Fontivita pretiosa]|uniref:hypothetical protein n=1 Tax=Fontivita pretiosa TaxID=2989684 RepID=UPI003D17DF93
MAFREDVDSQLIITIGAISGLMVIVATIGLQAWYMSEERDELERKSAGAVYRELVDLQADQRAKISSYRWVDRDKQVVAIPIDDAMKLLIRNQGKLPATKPQERPATQPAG